MTRETLTISVTRSFPSGGWECAAIIEGHREHALYFGYTKRQAVKAFQQEIKAEGRDV